MSEKDPRTYTPPKELDFDDILALSWGWRPSILLLEAHEAGVFDAVAGGWKTADEVAERLGADSRATRLLLLGLCGAGLMKKSGETFRNAPVVERRLVRGGEEYRGSILDLDRRATANWARIPEVVKTGVPIPKPANTEEEKKKWQETFIMAMDDIARQYTDKMFDALPLEDGQRLLDIGCGPATYLIDFAKRLPTLTAVAFDRPLSEEVIVRAAKRAGVADRIRFEGGDFTTSDFHFGDPFDGVLVSQIVHILSEEQARDLLRRAVAVTRPGGFVAVHEMTLGPDDDPGPAAVFAIQMMLGTQSGGVYAKDKLVEMMEKAGLSVESVTRIDARSETLVGRK